MNNFGVIELASAKTTSAPGWAYVPDTGPSNANALQPTNRKRARNAPGLSLSSLSARQEARIRKEVEALDKDSSKDAAIPLPVKSGRAQSKHTPNVRKILQSQKTFTNYLDDYLAMQALNDTSMNPVARPSGPSNASKRQAPGKKEAAAAATDKQPAKSQDVQMIDTNAAPILPPPYNPPPASHPGDDDPLLASRVPELPTDEELRQLLSHPPLAYVEASGTWEEKYPMRVFCEVCGYWGRVRCMKCGTRLCALDCLDTHREECVTRYGL